MQYVFLDGDIYHYSATLVCSYIIIYIYLILKGYLFPKIHFLSSFTPLNVIPKLTSFFFLWNAKEDISLYGQNNILQKKVSQKVVERHEDE